METTKLVSSPTNFNSAKIEIEEQEREEKRLRKINKTTGDRSSISYENQKPQKSKRNDNISTVDIRSQFIGKVIETYNQDV